MPEQEMEMMQEVLMRLARIETKIDAVSPRLEDHEVRIRELESKSGKKWEQAVTAVLSAIFVGVVGYLLGKLF